MFQPGDKKERQRVANAYSTMLDMIKVVMSDENSVTFNILFVEWFPDDKQIKKTIRKHFTDILGPDLRGNPKTADVIISLRDPGEKKCGKGHPTYHYADEKGQLHMWFCAKTKKFSSLKDLHCDTMQPIVSEEMLILEMAWVAEIL